MPGVMTDLTRIFGPGGFDASAFVPSTPRDPVLEFADELSRAGYVIDGLPIADGELHRCKDSARDKDKTGWYVLYLDQFPTGIYGTWHAPDVQNVWKGDRSNMTVQQAADHHQRIQDAKKCAEAAREARHSEAAAAARQYLKMCHPAPASHPYLIAKGVQPYGVLEDSAGRLVVPRLDADGMLWSYQTIDKSGEKRYQADGRAAGTFFLLGRPGSTVYIAEGFATAATVHEATGQCVAVAFDAGNLGRVGQALRKKYPASHLIFAADNDVQTPNNPGVTAARNAAQTCAGVVLVPELPEGSIGTDYNDLAKLQGLEEVKRQIGVAAGVKHFSRVDLSDLPVILEFPPRKWIIDEWLPAGRPALFHAQGGGGKTRVAIQASITTIINRDFFGWRPARQGSAVLVSGEEGAESIREIVWEICQALQLSPQEIQKVAQQLHILDLAGDFSAPILYTADGWNAKGIAVLEAIQDISPAVAFLDNVSACYGGPQTESGHIYGFVNGYSAAVGKEGAAVLLMHENKASATTGNREHAYSGIAAWHNACRSRIEMAGEKGSPNTRKLMRPKANYAAQQSDDDALILEWQRGAFLPRVAGSLVDNMRRENNLTQVVEYIKAVLAVARGPVSPNPRANNNPIAIGRDYGLSCHLSGGAFWAAVDDAVQRGFLRLEKYQKHNRQWSERFV